MKLSVALRLGRVSNLPTVTSNVLAAIALAGGVAPSRFEVVAICVAMSLMYVAGMFLNDAFDRDIDARERPERPIPAGEVSAEAVFSTGFAMLAAGVALVGAVALAAGTGSRPILYAVSLGSLIVFYDAYHKQNPLSPIVMGLCRVGVYATAAYAVTRDVDPALVRGMVALLGFLIGLTYIARQENLSRVDNLWPLAVMAVPAWLAFPHGLLAWLTYLAWLGQTAVALSLLARRKIRDAVGLLIASISLLDATFAANHHEPVFAINAALAFLATRWLQRSIAGT
ncbi:MAG TPA: UbiA family prenyltransferase [Kofleriaceae bacterium]|nr:UbiA family prenyltransferase [Kofleriaceae bacterium]